MRCSCNNIVGSIVVGSFLGSRTTKSFNGKGASVDYERVVLISVFLEKKTFTVKHIIVPLTD